MTTTTAKQYEARDRAFHKFATTTEDASTLRAFNAGWEARKQAEYLPGAGRTTMSCWSCAALMERGRQCRKCGWPY
ncbi:hypothetical protein MHM88_11390 [Epibacterium sp. MM17-32]|uniref:hypothetical protein n=1 Tax=Epibacterium sp. MM17-32 TaxID=2917734 RepID=UPI001EF40F3D|nr:hypothetical protein [Epibacterium sp. MM17-32]MCG7628411.1 hypothetical protein [Epibacterium sp. MM17-32]